ncbi:MAG: hypothetical protein HOV81_19305 [Kofleriaceae bacterium]|nr:hypothetical protein [Kofleriaceae bacterium]
MFSPTRPDPVRLARLPFGDAWLAVAPPTADVMDVRTRLAMYRLLVERAGGEICGAHDELNPFWGYASQLAWQHRSGRLGSPDSFAIEAESWWGCCNYALSVVPYVAAMHADLVPRLPITVPPRYATVLPLWQDALRAMRAGSDLDAIRLSVWRAHQISITHAVEMHERECARLPAPEQRFARGWTRMVDLFAAAGIRTDLDKIVESGGGALPSALLEGENVKDMPRHERSSARRVTALGDRPAWRWRLELATWRRIMRSREARADSERLLAALLGAGPDVWPTRRRALRFLLQP